MNIMLRSALRKNLGLRQQLEKNLLGDDGDVWESELKKFLRKEKCWVKNPVRTKSAVAEWEDFYLKTFNLKVDLSQVKIPERTEEQKREFTRLLIIAEGLTNNQVYDACTKHFSCSRYTEDLDKGVPTSERDPKNGVHAIWVRDTVEADEVHKNKSADMIRELGIKTETLLERMIHETKYFLETGKHLDISNWTLVSGSRDSGGSVPCAGWGGGKFEVGWDGAGDRGDGLRSRQVVS